jgi:hypothetical protein
VSTFPPCNEDGRQLPARVVDGSWTRKSVLIAGPPPEYASALFGLDHAVRAAVAADWTAELITNEVAQLVESYGAVVA